MQPILSTYHGERNEPGKKNLLRIGFTAGIILGCLMIIPAAVYPKWLCMLFGIAGSAAEPLAHTAIRIFVLGSFFAGISMLLSNYYQSVNREKPAFLIMTLRGGTACFIVFMPYVWFVWVLVAVPHHGDIVSSDRFRDLHDPEEARKI